MAASLKRQGFFLYGAAFLIFLLACAAFALWWRNHPLIANKGAVWRGYYMLLLEEGRSTLDFEERLTIDGHKYISGNSAAAGYSDFKAFVYSPLKDLPEKLDTLDPRYDDYLKKLPAFFRDSVKNPQWQIIYIESSASVLALYFYLLDTLIDFKGRWKLLDFEAEWRFFSFLLLLLCGFAAYWRQKIDLPTTISLIIVWLIYLAGADNLTTMIGVLFFPAFFCFHDFILTKFKARIKRLSENIIEKSIIFLFLLIVLWLLGALFFLKAANDSIWLNQYLCLIGLFAAGNVILGVQILRESVRRNRRFHPLFYYVPLKKNRPGSKQRKKELIMAVLFLACAANPFVLTLFSDILKPLPVPRPAPISNLQTLSWPAITKLAERQNTNDLPNMADYLTHRAFQEGFFYGREYVFPLPGEKIGHKVFSPHEKGFKVEIIYFKEFTYAWYDGILSIGSKDDIKNLLIKQARPVAVIRKNQVNGFSVWQIGYWLLLCLPPFLVILLTGGFIKGLPIKFKRFL